MPTKNKAGKMKKRDRLHKSSTNFLQMGIVSITSALEAKIEKGEF